MSQAPNFTSVGSKEFGACQEEHAESEKVHQQAWQIQSFESFRKQTTLPVINVNLANSPVEALAPFISSKSFAFGILLQ